MHKNRNFHFAELQITERQAADAENPRLTVAQAARYLGVSVPTLNRWRGAGSGPPWSRLGGRVYYTFADLQAFR